MIVTKSSAKLVSGLVTADLTYAGKPLEGAPVVTATFYKDGPEYVSYSFEGPPAIVRSFEVELTAYVGRVLATESRCERVMSDVWDYVRYATVLTDEGSFAEIYAGGTVTVDAPPALVAKWEEHKALAKEWARRTAIRAAAKAAKEEAAREAVTPRKGKTIKVVKGRKVPKGTVGECVWYGEGKKYSYYGSAPMRVGLKDASGTVHWTAASNVEVVAA